MLRRRARVRPRHRPELEREPVRPVARGARGHDALAGRGRAATPTRRAEARRGDREAPRRRARAASSSAAARARSCACATRPSSGPGGRWSPPSRPSRPCSHTRRSTKAEAVKVPLTADFRHDLAGHGRAPATRATGLVYVCNPNNPTGTIVTRRRARGLPRAGARRPRRCWSTRPTTTSSRTRLPLRARADRRATRTWSSRARSRRSTGWRACGSATRSPRRRTRRRCAPRPRGATRTPRCSRRRSRASRTRASSPRQREA